MLFKLNSFHDKDKYTRVKKSTLSEIGWKEKDLERLISNNIDDFICESDLMTIFTERQGQEEPDVLALDRNGELYIFELKREEGKQENLLQVLRYGQLYGNSDYDDLNKLYKKYTKNEKADLSKEHTSRFELAEKVEKNKYNATQHFLIMTNGIDQKTMEAIQYWKKVGLNIDAIIYWVYKIGNESYIEFNTFSNDKEKLLYENKCYILNTDDSNNHKHHSDMLNEHKAAAYGERYKEKIEKLQNGDIVFLYQSGKGIVAYGKADGKLNRLEDRGIKENEYNMHLTEFKKALVPINAKRIKELTKHNMVFVQTMFTVSYEIASILTAEIDNQNKTDIP